MTESGNLTGKKSLTAEQRSKIMASIHSKDTKPEMVVRRYLFACGFRFRVNSPRLPGKPDIVLRRYRTVVFVNGCFWHGHDCRYASTPKTNVEFWQNKIKRNKERDKRVQRKLALMGWHCITIWECQLKKPVAEQTLESLRITLNRIYINDMIHMYPLPQEDYGMAAEDNTPLS